MRFFFWLAFEEKKSGVQSVTGFFLHIPLLTFTLSITSQLKLDYRQNYHLSGNGFAAIYDNKFLHIYGVPETQQQRSIDPDHPSSAYGKSKEQS